MQENQQMNKIRFVFFKSKEFLKKKQNAQILPGLSVGWHLI